MAAIDFPNSPTNGQKFTASGMTWTYQTGVGWLIEEASATAGGFTFSQDTVPTAYAVGNTWFQTSTGDSFVWTSDGSSSQWVEFAPGGGSGFTFVGESKPTATQIGDTWFDTSTGVMGGSSWVAIEEAPNGELIWVQFSPVGGSGAAANSTFYCLLTGVPTQPNCGTAAVAIPWGTERYRSGLIRSGGRVSVPTGADGVYLTTAFVKFWPATSWPATGAGQYTLWVTHNGVRTVCNQTGVWDGSTLNTVGNCSGLVMLFGGDYVEVWIQATPAGHGAYVQNSGEFGVSRIVSL